MKATRPEILLPSKEYSDETTRLLHRAAASLGLEDENCKGCLKDGIYTLEAPEGTEFALSGGFYAWSEDPDVAPTPSQQLVDEEPRLGYDYFDDPVDIVTEPYRGSTLSLRINDAYQHQSDASWIKKSLEERETQRPRIEVTIHGTPYVYVAADQATEIEIGAHAQLVFHGEREILVERSAVGDLESIAVTIVPVTISRSVLVPPKSWAIKDTDRLWTPPERESFETTRRKYPAYGDLMLRHFTSIAAIYAHARREGIPYEDDPLKKAKDLILPPATKQTPDHTFTNSHDLRKSTHQEDIPF